MVAATSVEEGVVSLAKLRVFIPEKRPNYIKVGRVGLWQGNYDFCKILYFTME